MKEFDRADPEVVREFPQMRYDPTGAWILLDELENLLPPGGTGTIREQVEALVKDAERYRWLCDGNGYLLEEEGICGHSNEKPKADARIDQIRRDGHY